MDLKEITDERLDELRIELQNEQERRANVAMIPGQIQSLQQKFIEGGGDISELPNAPIID